MRRISRYDLGGKAVHSIEAHESSLRPRGRGVLRDVA
jgi:hypothetical protein